jgi:predicted transcriptional regulator
MLNGYLKMEKKKGSKAHYYEVVSYDEYNELQRKINTVLDESLEMLKKNLAEQEKPQEAQSSAQ